MEDDDILTVGVGLPLHLFCQRFIYPSIL